MHSEVFGLRGNQVSSLPSAYENHELVLFLQGVRLAPIGMAARLRFLNWRRAPWSLRLGSFTKTALAWLMLAACSVTMRAETGCAPPSPPPPPVSYTYDPYLFTRLTGSFSLRRFPSSLWPPSRLVQSSLQKSASLVGRFLLPGRPGLSIPGRVAISEMPSRASCLNRVAPNAIDAVHFLLLTTAQIQSRSTI